MENLPKTLDGCFRCPTCINILPEVKMEPNVINPETDDFVITCELHGHKAQGDTLEMAVKHWNIYVAFVLEQKAAS